jgi:hypothetical protein
MDTAIHGGMVACCQSSDQHQLSSQIQLYYDSKNIFGGRKMAVELVFVVIAGTGSCAKLKRSVC